MKVAFISDIHEDIVSLKRALVKIEKKNCDQIICLGDISGYNLPYYHHFKTRNASECLALIKDNCNKVIVGNHDLSAMKRTPKIDSGFEYPKDWYEKDYHERKKISKGKVWLYTDNELNALYTKKDLEYLNSLPEIDFLQVNDHKILLSHYIKPNIIGSNTDFFNHSGEITRHFDFMEELGCTLNFNGHVHANGLHVFTKQEYIQLRFNKRHSLKEYTCVSIPAIVELKGQQGFTILDSKNMSVVSLKF